VADWTEDELRTIGGAEELELSSQRADGTLRAYVTMWVVRVGDDLYVRSAYRRPDGWFARAEEHHAGRIRAGGLERDVAFERPGREVDDAVDAEYHTKYDRYGASIVDTVVGPEAARSTFRLRSRS
jgi:hypothetical protein